ncbi:MAG: hypothetical protein ABI346_02040 [Candidatus Baltobacteraceae bacterium]
MSATAKFYLGLFVALAAIVVVSYSIGYKVGNTSRVHRVPAPVRHPTASPHALPSS